ncbi:ATP-binding protein [Catellatospora tritici]|uniref:ATP-binding protein n=1 Tax=Catellatospora tritici TaxID=2851566 RepID=UPI001C2D31E3|nr:ATP-binding protein [Catellatospora tritici]MBV1852804.1 ATP-binding protein [Catellatospora tritici]
MRERTGLDEGRVRCAQERDSGQVTTTRLEGVLDLVGAASVLAFLLRALSGRPQALLVDVSGLELTDGSVSAFTDAARHAAAWPGCELLLYGQHGDLAAALSELHDRGGMALCADRDDALRQADSRTPARLRVQGLSPDLHAPAVARDMLADGCALWDVPAPAHLLLRQICSELVSNAVRHARTDFTLELRETDEEVHLAVRDHDPTLPPAPRDRSGDSRGLLLVDVLASHWGVTPVEGGKVVWATVRRTAG